ncbi:hypothetical protein BXZ70DRAFT_920852 [Cristinia sonorae]|uniref:Uncharacterized protein n=1 Tax=Cristinia sonorae TaxID=1940300 RepID=A0A8K0XTN4_9AGAR|nr:hypothetical protein BXZ70DRAFT_920852 [Cristinia sonorae]
MSSHRGHPADTEYGAEHLQNATKTDERGPKPSARRTAASYDVPVRSTRTPIVTHTPTSSRKSDTAAQKRSQTLPPSEGSSSATHGGASAKLASNVARRTNLRAQTMPTPPLPNQQQQNHGAEDSLNEYDEPLVMPAPIIHPDERQSTVSSEPNTYYSAEENLSSVTSSSDLSGPPASFRAPSMIAPPVPPIPANARSSSSTGGRSGSMPEPSRQSTNDSTAYTGPPQYSYPSWLMNSVNTMSMPVPMAIPEGEDGADDEARGEGEEGLHSDRRGEWPVPGVPIGMPLPEHQHYYSPDAYEDDGQEVPETSMPMPEHREHMGMPTPGHRHERDEGDYNDSTIRMPSHPLSHPPLPSHPGMPTPPPTMPASPSSSSVIGLSSSRPQSSSSQHQRPHGSGGTHPSSPPPLPSAEHMGAGVTGRPIGISSSGFGAEATEGHGSSVAGRPPRPTAPYTYSGNIGGHNEQLSTRPSGAAPPVNVGGPASTAPLRIHHHGRPTIGGSASVTPQEAGPVPVSKPSGPVPMHSQAPLPQKQHSTPPTKPTLLTKPEAAQAQAAITSGGGLGVGHSGPGTLGASTDSNSGSSKPGRYGAASAVTPSKHERPPASGSGTTFSAASTANRPHTSANVHSVATSSPAGSSSGAPKPSSANEGTVMHGRPTISSPHPQKPATSTPAVPSKPSTTAHVTTHEKPSTAAPPSAPQPTPQRPSLIHGTPSQMDTQYVNMLLALDDIPTIHNLAASFFNWILLAGFILFPGTFTSLQNLSAANGGEVPANLVNAVTQLPLYIVAWVCCGIGALGMIWLWWRWRLNYIWGMNKIFVPGLMNSLAGLLSTIASIFGAQHGQLSTTSKSTLIVTGACTGVFLILTGIYAGWLVRRVKRKHDKEVGMQKAGKHGEGVVDVSKRRVRT